METLIAHLLQNYGPTGVLVVALVYVSKGLLPLVVKAVEHLGRLADAVQKLVLQFAELGILTREIREQVGEVQEDVAGLYAMQAHERPSRRRKPVAAAATGD